MNAQHGERAHSKFSASGAERWFNCPASVHLSEGEPDKETEWSREGTQAHELLEEIMLVMIQTGSSRVFYPQVKKGIPREMVHHVTNAANFILGLHAKTPGADIMVETRVYLDFIHPEMFGTFDGAVLDHFGTLHVFDFKYGAGHAVSPTKNLQMIFYGIGLAHKYEWNFKKVRLWIIQPRIKGYDGPTFWDLSIQELKEQVNRFVLAVKTVEDFPDQVVEGGWCHWCKAKKKCPLKQESRLERGMEMFKSNPIGGQNGKEESKEKGNEEVNALVTEAEWRKKARNKGKKGKPKSKDKSKGNDDFF